MDLKVADNTSSGSSLALIGPPVRDNLSRYPWGMRRVLNLVIDASHTMVTCTVTSADGHMVGQLTATIQTSGSILVQQSSMCQHQSHE